MMESTSIGNELSGAGQFNLQAAIRCMLIAAIGACYLTSPSTPAQEVPGGMPTLPTVEAIRGPSWIPLPPPVVSIRTGQLASLNPNTIAYFLDGVRQDSYLGFETSQPDPTEPNAAPKPNPQPDLRPCDEIDSKATPGILNNPVNIVDGRKHASAVDFQSLSNADLKFARYKNPSWKGIGVLGQAWVTNFDYKISFTSGTQSCYPAPGKASCNIGNPTTISFYTEEGGIIQMARNGSGSFWQGRDTASLYQISKINDGSVDDGKYRMNVRGGSAYSPTMVFKTNGFIDYIDQRDGNKLTYHYDSNNRLYRVVHSSGRDIDLTWTTATPGAVTSITAPNGGVYRFEYYTAGTNYATNVNAPVLRKVIYPDNRGNIEYVHETGTSSTTGAAYTHAWKLMQIKVNGVPIRTYTYRSNSAVETSKLANGSNLIQYSYAPDSRDVTNAYGKKTTYKIEGGKVVETIGVASPNCPSSFKMASYLDNGLLEYATDERDYITRYEYDARGRRTKAVEAAGTPQQRTTTWTYDTDPANILRTELVKTITVAGLRRTTYTYTPDFSTFPNGPSLVASITHRNLSSGGTLNQDRTTNYTYTFHANGLIATVTEDGPLAGTGDRTITTYSGKGDLLSIQNSLGHKQTFSGHNDFGQPARIVDENGAAREYDYDARGRIVAERRYFNAVETETRYVYDAFGRLDSVVKPYGRSLFYRYDSVGRVTGQYEQMSNGRYEFESYDYNTASDVTAVYRGDIAAIPGPANPMPAATGLSASQSQSQGDDTNILAAPAGSTVSFKSRTEYDELGRVLFQRGNNGQYVKYTYDAAGNIATTTNALNHTTTYTYDALNRLASIKDARGKFTRLEYNVADQVTKLTDPRSLVTSYLYDGFGALWRLTSPDTKVTNYTYDAIGRLTNVSRANGKQVTYTYDSLGRVKTALAGGQTQTFTYDSCLNGKGRICAIVDPTGELSYTYSPEGQRLSQAQKISTSGINFGQAYNYDNLGRLTGVSYPGAVSIGYGYTLGRLTAVTARIGTASQNIATGMQYQPLGPVTGWTYGNGLTRTLLFDQNYALGDRRLTGVKTMSGASTLQSLLLAYDSRDLVSRLTNYIDASSSRNFEYDELGRLTKESRVGNETTMYSTYGYDDNGNRNAVGSRSPGTLPPPRPHVIDATSNRLMSIGGGSFTYDPAGNTLSSPMRGGATYSYDAFNRLHTVTAEGATTTSYVNALGQRNRKVHGSSQWGYLYGPTGQIEVEYLWGTGWTHYVRLPSGEPIAMVRSNQVYMLHTDHLGRPELATNSAKAVVWRGWNQTFDSQVLLDNIGGLNLGFIGQYQDIENFLWYNNNRTYDAATGRYLESDPAGLTAGVNTYTYVRSNPVNFVDPWGLVELNMIPTWDPAHAGMNAIPHVPGVFSVGVHFDGENFYGPDGGLMTAEQVADSIRGSPGYNGRDLVRMYSCRTGASVGGRAPAAQLIANSLPGNIQAPTNWVFVGPTQGFLGLSTKTPDGGMSMPRSGEWRLFSSGE